MRDSTFQSTLSVRRATGDFCLGLWLDGISIHALRKESDEHVFLVSVCHVISIHALRKESDAPVVGHLVVDDISIHALRKESDDSCCAVSRFHVNFNPRSP